MKDKVFITIMVISIGINLFMFSVLRDCQQNKLRNDYLEEVAREMLSDANEVQN